VRAAEGGFQLDQRLREVQQRGDHVQESEVQEVVCKLVQGGATRFQKAWAVGVARHLLASATCVLLDSDAESAATGEAVSRLALIWRIVSRLALICGNSQSLAPEQEECRRFVVRHASQSSGLRVLRRCLAASPVASTNLPWLVRAAEASCSTPQDSFLVHGERYATVRRMLTGGEKLDAENPAIVLLAIFREALSHSSVESSVHTTLDPQLLDSLREIATDFAKPFSATGILTKLFDSLVTNSLSTEAGSHRAILTVSADQPEAGHLLLPFCIHATLAVLAGGALAKPLRTLLDDPVAATDWYLPAVPCRSESRNAMRAVEDVTKWYVCERGHPYAVGDCGERVGIGRCECGARIGRGAAGLRYQTRMECDAKGLTGLPLPRREVARQLLSSTSAEAWREDWAPGPERSLNASTVCVLRAFSHAMLLLGAALGSHEHRQAVADIIGCTSEAALAWLAENLAADLLGLRNLLARSPEDAVGVLHIVCGALVDSGRTEPDVSPHIIDLSTLSGRADWENAFSRKVVSPVLESFVDGLDRLRELTTAAGADSDYLRQMLNAGSKLWRVRPRASLEDCHRQLERRRSDRSELTVLRAFLTSYSLLQLLRHLPSVLDFQHMLITRYHRKISLAEARKLTIGDFLQSFPEAKDGWTAFCHLWQHLWNGGQLAALLPTAMVEPLFRAAGDHNPSSRDAPLSMLLPNSCTEGICALAAVVALARAQNHFLRSNATRLAEIGVRPGLTRASLSRGGTRGIMTFSEDTVLNLLVVESEYFLGESRSAGLIDELRYDFDALEIRLARVLAEGTNLIDEKSAPKVCFLGRVCSGDALDAMRSKQLGSRVRPDVWQTLSNQLPPPPGPLCTMEVVVGFLNSSAGQVDPQMSLDAYIRQTLLLGPDNGITDAPACASLRVAHALELWQRLDLQFALRQLEAGRPVGEIYTLCGEQDQESMSAHLQAQVRECLPHLDHDGLLLALAEVLGVRWPALSPEWPLREVLQEQAGRGSGGQGLRIDALPHELSLRHASHLWRVIALAALDVVTTSESSATSVALDGSTNMNVASSGNEALPPSFSYASVHCHEGSSLDIKALWNGQPPCPSEARFQVHPPLPDGIVLTPSGDVNGVASAPWYAVHVVSCRTVAGARRTELLLRILPAPPPALKYEKIVCAVDIAMGAAPIFTSKIPAALDARFRVEPALPAGLRLDSSTGEISGIPQTLATTQHDVVAWNDGGTTSAKLIIEVVLQKPACFANAARPVHCGSALQLEPAPLHKRGYSPRAEEGRVRSRCRVGSKKEGESDLQGA